MIILQTVQLLLTVKSFVEIAKFLLGQQGVKFLLSEKFCQDPLEVFFGHQRAKGGHNDNPTVQQFCKTTVSLETVERDQPVTSFKWMRHHFRNESPFASEQIYIVCFKSVTVLFYCNTCNEYYSNIIVQLCNSIVTIQIQQALKNTREDIWQFLRSTDYLDNGLAQDYYCVVHHTILFRMWWFLNSFLRLFFPLEVVWLMHLYFSIHSFDMPNPLIVSHSSTTCLSSSRPSLSPPPSPSLSPSSRLLTAYTSEIERHN